eukprot:SAG31_NODE_22_length_33849_cov_13.713096_7_plen_107_part_00
MCVGSDTMPICHLFEDGYNSEKVTSAQYTVPLASKCHRNPSDPSLFAAVVRGWYLHVSKHAQRCYDALSSVELLNLRMNDATKFRSMFFVFVLVAGNRTVLWTHSY